MPRYREIWRSVPTTGGTPLVWSTSLDALANGSLAWCTPVSLSEPDWAQSVPVAVALEVQLTTGGSAPTANTSIDFYIGRADATIRDSSALGTLTATGVSADATKNARARNNLELIGSIVVDAGTAILYSRSFIIERPGPTLQLFVYNGIGQALATTADANATLYKPIYPEWVD